MERLHLAEAVRPKGTVLISAARPRDIMVPPILRRRADGFYTPDGLRAPPEHVLKADEHLYVSRQHIVVFGRRRSAELIGGVSSDYPDRVAVGDGGIATGTTSTPKVIPDDQADLEHEVTRQLVTQRIISDAGPPSITFIAVFKTAGAFQFAQPGQNKVSEIGLFTRDGVMCAAHNFAPIPVDVHRIGIMVEWEWILV